MRADNLHSGYNGAAVLEGVSFDLPSGSFVGVIGPNGSGKTTLLRAIARALPPKKGTVTLDGADIYSIPARDFARRVAVVPQETLVAFDFTVLEITLMGRSPRLGRFAVESPTDVQIAMDALRRTGTESLADRSINALSGGERQRVMVARALAQEPEVLLLDEPTSHLDINFQFEIMDLVKSLSRERGLTVLAVLHDLNLAGHYCEQLLLIGQGRIAASGPPEDVITADNVRKVYGAEVWVRSHPTTHRPYVIAGVRKRARGPSERFDSAPVVHVIGGGGAAAPIFARLVRRGCTVTSGVLSAGDADQEVADALDISFISQPPFAHISPESHEQHLRLIEAADLVVLTEVPVGHGNLPNVEAALEAVRRGRRVVVLKPELIRDRDFTGGSAAQMVGEMLTRGASAAQSVEELLRLVDDLATLA